MRTSSLRKRSRFNIVFAAYLLLACGHDRAGADTVYLKNGGELEGVIEKEGKEAVTLEMAGGAISVSKTEIKNIERSDADANKAMKERFKEKKNDLKSREGEFSTERDKRFDEYQRWQEEEQKNKEARVVASSEIQASRNAGGHILVGAVIDNKVKTVLMVDTGASLVILSKKIAAELGVDLTDTKKDIIELETADKRRVKAKCFVLKTLSIEGVEEKDVLAAAHLEEEDSVSLSDGLLGMSYLGRFNMKLDRATMKMTLERIGKR
jgi:clan AA aspartic protease (TIGR02281 family)